MIPDAFCAVCGTRFAQHDQFCAGCGECRRSQVPEPLDAQQGVPPPSAADLFPGHAPAPWSSSGTVLSDGAGGIAVYAVTRADAEAALRDLRWRNGMLSPADDGPTRGGIEAAMVRLEGLLTAPERNDG